MKPNLKAIVSICLLGSSLFAGSFSFAETIYPQQDKQDLSVFVWKLSSRLQEVFGELIDLWRGKSLSFSTSSSGALASSGSIPHFLDIENSLHKDDINVLIQYGVIDPSRQKFFPDNFLRRYELAIMYVKYQLVRGHQVLPQIVFPSIGRFSDVAQNISYAPYVAYGQEQGWFDLFIIKDDGKKFFKPNAFVTRDEVLHLMNLPVQDSDTIKIKRADFVHLLVSGSRDGLDWNESSTDVIVDTDAIPDTDNDTPLLDSKQVLTTLKTIFTLAR